MHFNKARQELELAKNIDEVKDIRDKAEALRAYAKQRGICLEGQNVYAEIKIRAERKAGEMLAEQVKPGNPQLLHDVTIAKLDDLGIERIQSSRWQKIASIPEETFEEHIKKVINSKKELTSVSVYNLARNIAREGRSKNTVAPPITPGKYRILYMDPPWKYSADFMDKYGHAEAHYKTMTMEELATLPIRDMAESDCVLFLWATSPKLKEAMFIMEEWGFGYKTSFVWDKVKHNFGYYNSVRHEFLLIGGIGRSTPDSKELHDSVISIERSKIHSEKPKYFRELIDKLYPTGKRRELFARGKLPDHWDGWGAEI